LVQAAIAEIDNISPCLGVLIKTPAEQLNAKSANVALASLPTVSD